MTQLSGLNSARITSLSGTPPADSAVVMVIAMDELNEHERDRRFAADWI